MRVVTDVQLLTLALAVVIPLSLLLYSNSRVSEAKETLRAEVAEAKETLRREVNDGFNRMEAAIVKLGHKLEVHELEHHK